MSLKLKTTTNFSAWHSGSWCCITMPSLVTKCSAVQKISSRQTFADILNLHCDLDLARSNQCFHWTLRLMMLYYQIKFGWKRTGSLEDILEIVILYWSIAVTLTLKIVNQFFCINASPRDNTPPYQDWVIKNGWAVGDRTTNGQTDRRTKRRRDSGKKLG